MTARTQRRRMRSALLPTEIVSAAVFLILLARAASAFPGESENPAQSTKPPTKKVQVSAERFHYVPSRIKVNEGTRLVIELESADVEHGFSIDGTDIDVRIPQAGSETVTVVFEPPAAGRYRFQCSHQCGAGHAGMSGVIVVKGGSKK